MSFIRDTFGGRKMVGCKESACYCPLPVDPWRLEVDKRLDVVMYQPRQMMEEQGTLQAMATWGRPMNPLDAMPVPDIVYGTGVYGQQQTQPSQPLSIGQVVRAMAADAWGDRLTHWWHRR